MIDIAIVIACLTVTISVLTGISGIVKYNLDSGKHFDGRLDIIGIQVNNLANNYEILEQKINANRVGETLVLEMIQQRFNAISDQLEFLKNEVRKTYE
jgi:hypothetical protein